MSRISNFTDTVVENLRACSADESRIESAVNLVAGAAGNIVAVGIGKSSFVARKFAASLQSIGVMARFLHPAEALHGDVGVIKSEDICVVISKSGNSQEINSLLPIVKERGCGIIALTNVESSPLAKTSDIVIKLHTTSEGDAHNILPLASCQVSLFLCDYLVLRIAERTGFSPERFRANHPGGQIGLNLNRSLNDLPDWKKRRPFVDFSTTLVDALIRISDSRAGMCCVTDSVGRLIGVVTDGDVRRTIMNGADVGKVIAGEIANRTPKTVTLRTPLTEILNVMECGSQKVSALPVLDGDGVCLGIIQIHDLMG